MNVRHDAPLEVTIKAGQRVMRTDVVEAQHLDAHVTVQSYCFGGAFNQANWHDDRGRPLARAPKMSYRLLDESYILRDGELCRCGGPQCLPFEAPTQPQS